MSYTNECTPECWVRVECQRCGMPKHPRGRDPGVYAASGYCGPDCPGYNEYPRAGHLWPSEKPDRAQREKGG